MAIINSFFVLNKPKNDPIIIMIRIAASLIALPPSFHRLFSSIKPPKDPNILKISKTKLSDTLHGHLIYKTTKTKSYFLGCVAMGCGVALCLYVFSQDPSAVNLIPVLISLGAFVYYQKKISGTVRQIVVDRAGDKMTVTKYGLFGSEIFSESVRIPIHIMAGIARKPINKGIAIRGGGQYGIKKFSYYFHETGVLDKVVFNGVISGKQIYYTDTL